MTRTPNEQVAEMLFHGFRAAKKPKDNPVTRAILKRMVKRGVVGHGVLE